MPGDPEQVIYVWFDALVNYVSALGLGGDDAALRRRWCGPAERRHVIGKGIVRFRVIVWPAILLSAGLPLPSELFVHGYVTVGARKIGKSLGNLVHRVAKLAEGLEPDDAEPLEPALVLPERVDRAIENYDLRAATGAIADVVADTNPYLERTELWRIDDPARAHALSPALAATGSMVDEPASFPTGVADRAGARLGGSTQPVVARLDA